MNQFFISTALSVAFAFIGEAIKNPKSAKAEQLKFRLIELRDQLDFLIKSRWPEVG